MFRAKVNILPFFCDKYRGKIFSLWGRISDDGKKLKFKGIKKIKNQQEKITFLTWNAEIPGVQKKVDCSQQAGKKTSLIVY